MPINKKNEAYNRVFSRTMFSKLWSKSYLLLSTFKELKHTSELYNLGLKFSSLLTFVEYWGNSSIT